MRRLLSCGLLIVVSLTVAARDYIITDFGAKSDTTVLCTAVLQQCIDLCSEAGGGRVVIPAGNYKTGSIVLRSNVNLHLELGATLYGSTNLQDYRRMTTSYKSLRTHTPTIQLIYADSVENVVIDGYGTIDGQGRVFPKLSWNDEGITRPHLLRFIQSRDIMIRDITLRNSGCWMQHYLACDRVRIDGIKVTNRNNYNNDALDLDGCHDVIVRGVIADSDDDGITLKSTSPRLCEDIAIENCIVSSHCNAVKLGTETNGGFRNISIRGIVVKPSEDQSTQFFGRPRGTSALSLEIVDGGLMENVSVDGMTIVGTESPIFVRLAHRGRGWTFNKSGADAFVAQSLEGGNEGATRSQKPDSIETVGQMRGLYINNVRAKDCGNYGCSVTGLPDHPVEDVHISNISIHHNGSVTKRQLSDINKALRDEKAAEYPEATMWGPLPAKGFYVRHARSVHFDNVEVYTEQADARPDFVKEDVQ
jgi:polygalacturonase